MDELPSELVDVVARWLHPPDIARLRAVAKALRKAGQRGDFESYAASHAACVRMLRGRCDRLFHCVERLVSGKRLATSALVRHDPALDTPSLVRLEVLPLATTGAQWKCHHKTTLIHRVNPEKACATRSVGRERVAFQADGSFSVEPARGGRTRLTFSPARLSDFVGPGRLVSFAAGERVQGTAHAYGNAALFERGINPLHVVIHMAL